MYLFSIKFEDNNSLFWYSKILQVIHYFTLVGNALTFPVLVRKITQVIHYFTLVGNALTFPVLVRKITQVIHYFNNELYFSIKLLFICQRQLHQQHLQEEAEERLTKSQDLRLLLSLT